MNLNKLRFPILCLLFIVFFPVSPLFLWGFLYIPPYLHNRFHANYLIGMTLWCGSAYLVMTFVNRWLKTENDRWYEDHQRRLNSTTPKG